MQRVLRLLVCLCVLAVCGAVGAAATPYDSYLTAADVEKVSEMSGIKTVPYDPGKGAGGDLNFATSDDRLVVMANFLSADFYDEYRNTDGYFKASVDGVGEEAFCGPKNDPQYVLIFRQGTYCVTLSSFFNLGGETPLMLTMDQLITLGKSIASRIK